MAAQSAERLSGGHRFGRAVRRRFMPPHASHFDGVVSLWDPAPEKLSQQAIGAAAGISIGRYDSAARLGPLSPDAERERCLTDRPQFQGARRGGVIEGRG